LSRALPDGRTLLLVLDGVDESADWEAGPDLFQSLGARVRVVLSARHLAGDAGSTSWLRRVGWTGPRRARVLDLGALTRAGVSEVLASAAIGRRWGDDLVAELFRLTEGDPLLVRLYVAALVDAGSESASLGDLARRQPGLDGYFGLWWEEQNKLWGTLAPSRERTVWAVLNLLACALGPMRQADLLRLMPPEIELWTFEDALRSLKRLVVGDGVSHGYAFSHPRLAGYFYDKLQRAGQHRRYEARFAKWGTETLHGLANGDVRPSEVPSYVLLYHRSHLERLGADAKEFAALLTNGWRRAWEQIDRGSYAGFLTDVGGVRRILENFDANALRAGRSPSYIGEQLLCALSQSSIGNLAGRMDSELLAALAEREVWTAEQTLAHMSRVPYVGYRISTVLELASRLPPLQQPLLLDAALADLSAGAAIGGQSGVLNEVLDRLQGALDRGETKDKLRLLSALCALARRMPEATRANLLLFMAQAACRSVAGDERDQVLKTVAAQMSESERDDIVSKSIPLLVTRPDGAVALLCAFYPDRALLDVLVSRIKSSEPLERTPLLPIALEAARLAPDPLVLFRAISDLSPFVGNALTEFLDVARAKADEIQDPRLRFAALLQLARTVAPHASWSVLESAWLTSQRLDDAWRLTALVELASYFPDTPGVSRLPATVAVEMMLRLARGQPAGRRPEWIAVAAPLIDELPAVDRVVSLDAFVDLMGESAGQVTPVEHPTGLVRLRELATKIGRSPTERWQALLDEAVHIICAQPTTSRAESIALALERLPLESPFQGVPAASESAWEPAREMLRALAPRLSNEEIPIILKHLISVANHWSEIRRIAFLSETLHCFAARVDEEVQGDLYGRIATCLDAFVAAESKRLEERAAPLLRFASTAQHPLASRVGSMLWSLDLERVALESGRIRALMRLSAVVAVPLASQALSHAIALRDMELSRATLVAAERAGKHWTLLEELKRYDAEKSWYVEPSLLEACRRALADVIVPDDLVGAIFSTTSARGASDWWSLWDSLVRRLPASLVPAAFSAAWRRDRNYLDNVVRSMNVIWHRERGSPPLAEVLQFLRSLDPASRAEAISCLSSVLPAAGLAEAVADALRSTREALRSSRGDADGHYTALQTLAPFVPDAQVADALGAIRATGGRQGKSHGAALAAYAHRLPREEHRRALLEVLALNPRAAVEALLRFPKPDEDLVARVFDVVKDDSRIFHLLLAPQLVEVAAVATTIDNRHERAWSIGELALRVPGEEETTRVALSETLATMKELTPARLAQVMAQVVPHVDRSSWLDFLNAKVSDGVHRAPYDGRSSMWVLEVLGNRVTEASDEVLEKVFLAACDKARSEDDRAFLFHWVAPAVPRPWLERAVSSILDLQSEGLRSDALLAVSPYASEALLERILGSVTAMSDDTIRGTFLSKLLPFLPARLMPRATYLARAMASDAGRALALASLAPHLSVERRHGALWRALAALDDRSADDLSDAQLRAICAELQGDLKTAALAAFGRLRPRNQVRMLCALSSTWPGDSYGELVAAAESIATTADRAEAMRWVAIHVTPILPEEALSAIRGIGGAYERSLALSLAAHGLADAAKRQTALEEALATALSVEDRMQRAERLVELVPRLSSSALSKARSILFDTGGSWDAADLAELGPSLPDSLVPDVVGALGDVQHEGRRVAALRVLAPRLGPASIQAAISACALLQSDALKAAAIGAVSRCLPEDLEPSLLAVAETITRDQVRAELMCDLLQRFHGPSRSRSAEHALGAIERLPVEAYRAAFLTRISAALPETLVERALAAVTTIGDELLRADSLGGLRLQGELAPRAIDLARCFGDSALRAVALAQCSAGLPERDRAPLLVEAVDAALAGESRLKRADTLREMVIRMPVPSEFVQAAALKAASGLGDAWYLSNAIEAVAAALLPGPLDHACVLIGEISNESARARAIAAISPHIAVSQYEQLLAQVRALRGEHVRAEVLCEIAADVPESFCEDLLALAEGFQSHVYRSDVLCSLAPYLPEPLLARALDQAFLAKDLEVRYEAVRRLLRYLPQTLLRVVLARADEFGQAYRTRLRSFVTQLLSAGVDAEGPDSVKGANFEWMIDPDVPSDGPSSRPLPSVGRLRELLEEATAIAPPSDGDSGSAAAAWSPEVASRALRTLSDLPSEKERADRLKRIAPFLQESDMPGAFDILGGLREDDCRVAAIRSLANVSFGYQWLQRACEQACRIETGEHMLDALDALVSPMMRTDLPRLYDLWCSVLRLCSNKPRSDLLGVVRVLAPVIELVGGTSALRGAMDAIQASTDWWP
jgi:hypothetical protein